MLVSLKKKLKSKNRWLHKNLDFLLHKFGLDIKSLSLETNVPPATIVRMKKEDNNPTIATLEPLADFFRIDLHDFLYEDISSEKYQNKKRVGNIQYVAVTNLAEIKKWPMQLEHKIIVGTVGNLNEGAFGICIDTESMAPLFYKNSIIIIDPAIEPKDGDYVFCVLEKNIPVLRQFFIDGGNYFFRPINPNYGGLVNVKKFTIVGVVVKSIESYR